MGATMATLEGIAKDMKRQAARCGEAYRSLGHGLDLHLWTQGGQWYLELSRPAVRPSATEEAICDAVFDVPGIALRRYTDTSAEVRWPVDDDPDG
jgi:hypothetical protein